MHLAFSFLILFEPVTAIQSSQFSINEYSTSSVDNPTTPVVFLKRTQLNIPLQLVMTAKSGGINDLPTEQRNNVRETLALNPGLTLRFLTDEACRTFIYQNYGPELAERFDMEGHGSYRGDICRAAVIAIEGGFYVDVDMQFRVPLVDMVDESTTFMSALDMSCNVLNALFAAEPSSAVMQSVMVAIEDWYANPNTTRPKGSLLGTVTMLDGLNDVVKRDCPGMDIKSLTHLQRACGSHHQFRLYKEQRISCRAGTKYSAECPIGRKNNFFDGVKYGLFGPGTGVERTLVAWSRFENCTQFGCNQRLAQSAALGECPQHNAHPAPPVQQSVHVRQVTGTPVRPHAKVRR